MKPAEGRYSSNEFFTIPLTLSRHSRDKELHAGVFLWSLGWPGKVLAGCQNPPTGNSFLGRL